MRVLHVPMQHLSCYLCDCTNVLAMTEISFSANLYCQGKLLCTRSFFGQPKDCLFNSCNCTISFSSICHHETICKLVPGFIWRRTKALYHPEIRKLFDFFFFWSFTKSKRFLGSNWNFYVPDWHLLTKILCHLLHCPLLKQWRICAWYPGQAFLFSILDGCLWQPLKEYQVCILSSWGPADSELWLTEAGIQLSNLVSKPDLETCIAIGIYMFHLF